MECSMKKYFGCFYFLFYVLSLMVLEIFFDANTFFNYAIFMGFVLFLEIMSWFILYIIYKVSNYLISQTVQRGIKQNAFG